MARIGKPSKQKGITGALEYLLNKEWSMGNGQCGDCCGAHRGWYNHPCYMETSSIGHKLDCGAGLSIRELGGETLFKGEFTDDMRTPEEIERHEIAVKSRDAINKSFRESLNNSIKEILREHILEREVKNG